MAVFHKLCEKYYRKSCEYRRNNSTKQKVKKSSTSHYRLKFRAQRYGDKLPPKSWKALKRKKVVHTSCEHGVRRICQLYTVGGPAGKLMWCGPPTCTFVNKPITWLAAVVNTKGDAWNANIELFKCELKSLLSNQSRAWWKGRTWKFCRK